MWGPIVHWEMFRANKVRVCISQDNECTQTMPHTWSGWPPQSTNNTQRSASSVLREKLTDPWEENIFGSCDFGKVTHLSTLTQTQQLPRWLSPSESDYNLDTAHPSPPPSPFLTGGLLHILQPPTLPTSFTAVSISTALYLRQLRPRLIDSQHITEPGTLQT